MTHYYQHICNTPDHRPADTASDDGNLLFTNPCYKDFSETFQFPGDTNQVRKPTWLTAEDFDESPGVNYQDLQETTLPTTLDHIATGLELYKDIPYVSGTAGTIPNFLDAFAGTRKVFNVNKAPTTDAWAYVTRQPKRSLMPFLQS